jgi:hypothetical protein
MTRHAAPSPHAEVRFDEFLWIWNTRAGQGTPALHLRIARWLQAREQAQQRRLLLMAFRGAGKSTLVGMWCAWQLMRAPNARLLVLGADDALAVKMVRNVRRIIERHPLCALIRPQRAEEWAADRFTVRRPGAARDPSMLARGITSNITGSRADIIIADDVEVPNTSDTAAKREELRARLAEAAFVLAPGGTMLFVGTPHAADSLYADPTLPRAAGAGPPYLADCARLVIPIIDEAGASAWPERFTPAEIAALRLRVGPQRFMSQMLLQPVDPGSVRLDPAQLVRYAGDLTLAHGNGASILRIGPRRMASATCFWDPAFGAPGRGDSSVLAALFADETGGFWLHRVLYFRHDPRAAESAAAQLCAQVADLAAALHLPAVTVETNGIGKFLPGLLRETFATRRLACAVREQVATRAKDERIIAALEPVMAARRLNVHESVFATPFIQELRDFRPGARGLADDGLDAVAGCLLAEPLRLAPRAPPGTRPDWQGGSYAAGRDFDPLAG